MSVNVTLLMLARFVVLGVVPFAAISFLNYKIWLVVR